MIMGRTRVENRFSDLQKKKEGGSDVEKSFYRVILHFVKVLNVILLSIPVAIFWKEMTYTYTINTTHNIIDELLIMVVFIILYVTFGRIYDAFAVSVVHISEMIYSQCLALFVSDAVMYMLICLMTQCIYKIVFLVAELAVQLLLSILWCWGTHVWYFKVFLPKKTAIIYDQNHSVEVLINAYDLRKKFEVCVSETVDDCLSDECASLQKVETVFLCGVHSHERNKLLKFCVEHNINVYVLPRIGDVIMSGARPMHLFHRPFLRVGRYDPVPEYLVIKRLFDVIVSVVALIISSPVMFITAMAIKLTDGGTVFYKQKRLTQNGREFDMIKFRSMRQDAEKDGVARLSTGDQDDRITHVGRIIRKYRIDELPQLLNILQGSMSIVGPRPERPEIAWQYGNELPEFSLRLQAKAGLTGYAQVYGKYNTTPYDKLQMDLIYIAHPSFWEDLRIIFLTVKILFIPESTEGIAVGMETAMNMKKQTDGRDEKFEV